MSSATPSFLERLDLALRLGGEQPSILNDVTGNAFFEGQLTLRLQEIGSAAGPDFVPIIRGGGQ